MNLNINLLNYIEHEVGSISWAGETNHDNQSSLNMNTLEDYLTQLEDIYLRLLSELVDHKIYRDGNASAEHLHIKAKSILEHRIYAFDDFKHIMDDLKNWDPEDKDE